MNKLDTVMKNVDVAMKEINDGLDSSNAVTSNEDGNNDSAGQVEETAENSDILKQRLEQIQEVSEKMQIITQKMQDPNVADPESLRDELEKMKKLASELMNAAQIKGEKSEGPNLFVTYPWEIRARGIMPARIKNLRILLKRATKGETFKFAPASRGTKNEMVLCFKTKEHMDDALKILNDYPLGMKVHAEPVGVEDTQMSDDGDAMKKLQEMLQNGPPQTEEEYAKQLELKNAVVTDCIHSISTGLEDVCSAIVKDRSPGYIFKLDSCRPCPLVSTNADRYVTYSGVDKTTGELGLEYNSLTGNAKSNLNPSSILASPVEVMKEFIQRSGKPLYNPVKKEGFWYSLMARSNHVGNILLLVVIHTDSKEQAEKDCDELAPQLLKLFGRQKHGVASLVLRSVYEAAEQPSGEVVREVIGQDYIEDEAAGLMLRIRSKTFFWSNPHGAQALCETIAELLELNETSALVEIGCRSGIFGLYLSKVCSKVFMLDKSDASLVHATENAQLNGVINCEFIEGGLRENVDQLRKKLLIYGNAAAIVSDTFNTRSSRLIREIASIDKLVYITMANRECVRNLAALCADKGDGMPFVPVKVIPVDMNPGVVQLEIVFLLERRNMLKNKLESREEIEAKLKESLGIKEAAPPAKRKRDNRSPPRDRRSGGRWERDRNRPRPRSRERRGGGREWDDYGRERRNRRGGGFGGRGSSRRSGNYGPTEGIPSLFDSPSYGNANLESAILNVVAKVVASSITSGNQGSGPVGSFENRYEEDYDEYAGDFQEGFDEGPGRGFNDGPGRGFNEGPGRGFNEGPGKGFNADSSGGYGRGFGRNFSGGYGQEAGGHDDFGGSYNGAKGGGNFEVPDNSNYNITSGRQSSYGASGGRGNFGGISAGRGSYGGNFGGGSAAHGGRNFGGGPTGRGGGGNFGGSPTGRGGGGNFGGSPTGRVGGGNFGGSPVGRGGGNIGGSSAGRGGGNIGSNPAGRSGGNMGDYSGQGGNMGGNFGARSGWQSMDGLVSYPTFQTSVPSQWSNPPQQSSGVHMPNTGANQMGGRQF